MPGAPLVLLVSPRPRVALPAAVALVSAGYRTLIRPALPNPLELADLDPWFIAVDATEASDISAGNTIDGCPIVPLAFLEPVNGSQADVLVPDAFDETEVLLSASAQAQDHLMVGTDLLLDASAADCSLGVN
jgi:hypothetical protein